MNSGRLTHGIPPVLPEEWTELLAAGGGCRVERIVSRGHCSPPGFWYDQAEHEWVMVAAGRARLVVEGRPEPLELGPGGWVELPAGLRHRVEWTDPGCDTVWLAVFYPASPAAPETAR